MAKQWAKAFYRSKAWQTVRAIVDKTITREKIGDDEIKNVGFVVPVALAGKCVIYNHDDSEYQAKEFGTGIVETEGEGTTRKYVERGLCDVLSLNLPDGKQIFAQ